MAQSQKVREIETNLDAAPEVCEARKSAIEEKLASESPVWTIKEAASYCHVPASLIRRWIARGAISYRRDGKAFLVRKSEVIAELDKRWVRGSIEETPRKNAEQCAN